MDLFDEEESDNEVTFKSNSEYAKKYNVLRRKEELLKLKNKYGDQTFHQVAAEESSTSEDEDEEVIFTEAFEKDFFKTLSCLKNKDPRIYNKDVKFFSEAGDAAGPVASSSKQTNKEKPMMLRDFNRKIILEKEGKYSDDEEEEEPSNGPTYVQEQMDIKKTFSKVVNEDSGDEEGDQLGGLFSKKSKSKEEEDEEETGYREWLSGQVTHLEDDAEEKDLKPLKDYWNNPTLGQDETFLRDYFLKQKFREESSKGKIPTYDEIVNESEADLSDDEKLIGEQTEFEHKFNFRFEEPDQDFIKRYPRTLEHSMRRKDDKRTKKRNEIKERKVEEKQRKKEEISQLKSLKLKEIQEKIVQLKEITGNEQLAFNDEDIEGDFDPDAHDRRMRELFDEEYYGDQADDQKPEFPDLDEEMKLGKCDKWGCPVPDNGNYCEDEDFNMDCDYVPNQAKKKTLVDDLNEPVEGKRKRKKRKNKLAEVLEQKKPDFDLSKTDKTVAQHLDEYYKLDCEDVIGDMACRFKYREVPALDYGLTTEEILMADDAELNRWYPLKKTLMYWPDHKQLNDQKVYESKARNLQLKMKILPSLFRPRNDEEENENEEGPEGSKETTSKKKRKRKKQNKNNVIENTDTVEIKNDSETNLESKDIKKKKHSIENVEEIETNMEESNVVEETLVKKSKKKKNDTEDSTVSNDVCDDTLQNDTDKVITKKKRNRNKAKKNIEDLNGGKVESSQSGVKDGSVKSNKRKYEGEMDSSQQDSGFTKKRRKYNRNKNRNVATENGAVPENSDSKKQKGLGKGHSKPPIQKDDAMNNISDERLKAFGLNPKKYRSFMKFKKY